jgi:hypothetical protein
MSLLKEEMIMTNPYDQDETCDGCGKDASVCECEEFDEYLKTDDTAHELANDRAWLIRAEDFPEAREEMERQS